MTYRPLLLAALLALAACSEDVQPPPEAVAMTEEAVGHYCQMIVLEHNGPKGQIHIAGQEHPLWFSQVRDAIAFMRSPEETAQVRAFYVNDMSHAKSWNDPGADNWISASEAFFVIDSALQGGMGAPEAVPFGSDAAARSYVERHSGRIVRLDDIPDDYVLAPVEVVPSQQHQTEMHGQAQSHGTLSKGVQTQ